MERILSIIEDALVGFLTIKESMRLSVRVQIGDPIQMARMRVNALDFDKKGTLSLRRWIKALRTQFQV
jgi:hypothetical protein